MSQDLHHGEQQGFHGWKCWILSLLAGLLLGLLLAKILPKPELMPLADIAAMKEKSVETFKAENEDRIRDWENEHRDGAEVKPEDKDGAAAHGGHNGEKKPTHWSEIKAPDIPLYLSIPFALLLLSIALMPFISLHFWEHHYPDFAFVLGGIMISYYLFGLNTMTTLKGLENYGLVKMEHVGVEFYQFIALVGSLYVVTGGVLIDIKGKAAPKLNVAILIIGAVIANVIGTTGAAALLIRSYIRINKHRIRPFHIVFFIFIVANCGGCLTPIGDPPLFLGFLQGVPFEWTLFACLPGWAAAVGLLVLIFYILDVRALARHEKEKGEAQSSEKNSVRITGLRNFIYLAIVLLGVFLDGFLTKLFLKFHIHFPVHGAGAALQIVTAAVAYRLSRKDCLKANEFTFAPIQEVGFLFFGLFATMVPALDYLGLNAKSLGVASPTSFFWATGALSSFLDNAPTYLNFFAAAHGLAGMEMALETKAWMGLASVGSTAYSPNQILLAISLSAVFFGANTYIGNAPNFMVKAISESSGVRMPSFFGYVIRYTLPVMIPVLIVIWIIFVSGWVF